MFFKDKINGEHSITIGGHLELGFKQHMLL